MYVQERQFAGAFFKNCQFLAGERQPGSARKLHHDDGFGRARSAKVSAIVAPARCITGERCERIQRYTGAKQGVDLVGDALRDLLDHLRPLLGLVDDLTGWKRDPFVMARRRPPAR